MSGKAIGKSLGLGYEGTVSRNQDCVIVNRVLNKESEPVFFGQAVVLESDNTVRKIEAGDTADKFMGIAVREVKQTTSYFTSAGIYNPLDPTDILTRGSITVKCNNGKPTAGSSVHIRISANDAIPTGVIGEIEAIADGSNTIQIDNIIFTTGQIDSNNIAEVTILNRRA